MKGAREYYDLIKTGQYGKLYIQMGSHARGKTMRIFIIPEGLKVVGSIYNCKNAVEVYGIVSGNPGWTEQYGWLHRGGWVADFDKIVAEAKKAKAKKVHKEAEKERKIKKETEERERKLLEQY